MRHSGDFLYVHFLVIRDTSRKGGVHNEGSEEGQGRSPQGHQGAGKEGREGQTVAKEEPQSQGAGLWTGVLCCPKTLPAAAAPGHATAVDLENHPRGAGKAEAVEGEVPHQTTRVHLHLKCSST